MKPLRRNSLNAIAALSLFLPGVPALRAAGIAATLPAAQDGDALTVPAGTSVQLTLVNLIMSKSTPIGGTIRASVAFPVTVGTQIAIPAGVFAEGQLVQDSLPKGTKIKRGQTPPPALKVHFTRLVYPSGYTVGLDAETALAEMPPLKAEDHLPELAFNEFSPSPQTTTAPTLPALPPLPGPNVGLIVGLTVVPLAIVAGTGIYLAHHAKTRDAALFAPGYQFQMSLAMPLTLDRTRVLPAGVTP